VERRRLGNSDLAITPIGFGTWAIGGGDWIFGWGPQDDAQSLAALRRGIDRGINWIDTAAVYGLGRSERIVARALRDLPRHERPYVFTKCSLVWDELGNVSHSLRPQSIRREVEASLRRLEVDCIDLYQIDWPIWPSSPSGHDPGSLEEAWATMAALRREGKVRFIGVSNCDATQLALIHPIAPVTSLQPPYSLLRREIEQRTLPFCEKHNIGVIVYSPMQSGLLTGKMTRERITLLPHNDWRRWNPAFQEPVLTRALQLVERLHAVAARYARTPGEIAIAWTLHNPAVTAAIVGARRPQQVDEIVGAASLRLSRTEIGELEQALTGGDAGLAPGSVRL
jgi:aryl-alcohol dehydrogenase-like predicted oxidoreductase